LSNKFGGTASFGGSLSQPLPQPGGRVLVEDGKAEVVAKALGLPALGLFAPRRIEKENWRQVELARQMIDDAQRRLPVIVENRPCARSMQSCSAKRRLWSAPRQRLTSRRSAGDRLQCRASSSSLGSAGIAARRRTAVGWGGSGSDIEVRALEIGGKIVARRARVDGRGVERFVPEQPGQFDQLAGIVAQIAEGKGVAQRMGKPGFD